MTRDGVATSGACFGTGRGDGRNHAVYIEANPASTTKTSENSQTSGWRRWSEQKKRQSPTRPQRRRLRVNPKQRLTCAHPLTIPGSGASHAPDSLPHYRFRKAKAAKFRHPPCGKMFGRALPDSTHHLSPPISQNLQDCQNLFRTTQPVRRIHAWAVLPCVSNSCFAMNGTETSPILSSSRQNSTCIVPVAQPFRGPSE